MNFDDLLGETKPEIKEENDSIVINVQKKLILDLFCLHGETGIIALGETVGDILAEQITILLKAQEDKLEERKHKLFEQIKKEAEERNARNKS